MGIKFSDNALTQLAVPLAGTDTVLTVALGTGDRYPQVTGGSGDYFVVTMENAAGNREFIRVDNRAAASDTFGNVTYPLQRGYWGTTARAWAAGDIVDLRPAASALNIHYADLEAFRNQAATSAGNAATSETNAATSASNSAASAAAAATSAGNAATSETNAATSASNSAASAAAAATSAGNAATSETNAATSAASVIAMDKRYLGEKVSDPTLDNQGAALQEGALYWNTAMSVFRVYSISGGWGDVLTPADGSITNSKLADPTLSALAALDSTVGVVYQTAADSFSKAPLSGKNRIINGRMLVDQRYAGAAHTITAGAALAYTVDRWWAACTGADVTGQRVSTGYQFTGAASVTGIQFGQRIERLSSYDLAGGNATFQVNLANSLLTSVTWTAYYANTNDTFGTLASPAKTQIATGTFTVTSTLTQYSATFAVPAGATTGIEIVFAVGAQTSGTWVIGKVQFEKGSVATGYEIEDIELSNVRCMRYYEASSARVGGYNTAGGYLRSAVYYAIKRAAPTVTISTTESANAGTITVDLVTSNSLRYLQVVTTAGDSFSSSLLYIDSEMKS